jgi:serine/threonine protein kinase
MNINHGTAGSALCVLVPPYNCKSKKYNNNYVSKIVEYSNKKIIINELRIAKYLLKHYKKTILYKYFSLILDSCVVKSNKQLGKCKKTQKNKKYIVLYSKNAGCKPITKSSKVFVKTQFNKMNKIKINNIQSNVIISNNIKYKKNNIIRKCGDLSSFNGAILTMCFSKKYEKNNVKRLIKILSLLHKLKVIHCDIKLDNIISNNKKEIRLIDFGVSILLSDLQNLNLDYNFNVLLNKFHSKFYGWTTNYISPEIIIVSKFFENNDIDKDNMIILLKNKLETSFYLGYVNSTNHQILTQLVDYVYNNKMQFLIDLIDGEIFKTDIYSMGITLYYIFNYVFDNPINLEIDKENNKLVSLIYNMTLIDYRSRFNINKCTNSDYFK